MKYYEITFDDLKKIGYQGSDYHSGLRFSGKNVEKVNDPHKADAIIIPLSTRENGHLTPQLYHRIIEHYKIDERRFVTYDCSDEEWRTDKYVNGIFIRCSAKNWYVQQMPNTISWSWPVEDMKDCVDIPKDGFKYKIGFRGWLSSNVRHSSVASCYQTFGSDMDHYTTNQFYGYFDTPGHPQYNLEEARIRKELFKDSLRNCLLQLTPASIWHVFPYRYFEAMSAGRVPVLFCDGFVDPWVGEDVDWNKCTVRFTSQDAPNAGPLIKEWLSHHSEEEIIEMGRYGRKVWDKWLNRDKYPELHTMAVEDKLKKLGLLK